MSMHTTAKPEPHSSQGCGCCGTAPTGTSTPCRCRNGHKPSECGCGLERLERPLFTAGMVLSDSDLTALVDWTRARLGLQRFRDGWGAVCGLDVRCDPDHPGSVIIEPGYAVSCCGEDVVVCEPQRLDLSECCADPTPCGEPDPPGPDLVEGADKPDLPVKDGQGKPCGDVAVDLMLAPQDSLAGTELIDGCGCSHEPGRTDSRIVPTRLREGSRVEAVPVFFPAVDPLTAVADQVQAEYSRCHEIVQRYVEAGEKSGATRDDVVGWLRRQELDPPCGWWTTLCAALDVADGDVQVEAAVAAALFDLVMDCRQRMVRRVCNPCTIERINLARVWLRRVDDARHGTTCVVAAVDAYPPVRRELAPTSRPMPTGADDLAPFIWQRWDQVCHRWRGLASNSSPSPATVPGTTEDLLLLFEDTDRLWWPCDESAPDPIVVTTPCLGDRVVGFRRAPDTGLTTSAAAEISLEDVTGVSAAAAALLRAADISTVEELSLMEPAVLAPILGAHRKVQLIHDAAVRLMRTRE